MDMARVAPTASLLSAAPQMLLKEVPDQRKNVVLQAFRHVGREHGLHDGAAYMNWPAIIRSQRS
jgi:hypothetical protein